MTRQPCGPYLPIIPFTGHGVKVTGGFPGHLRQPGPASAWVVTCREHGHLAAHQRWDHALGTANAHADRDRRTRERRWAEASP